MNFSTIFISVFLLINPFGAIPIFLAILANFNDKQKIIIMIRESFFALIIASLFFFFGKGILEAMNISVAAVETAGGVILFLMAIKMIYPSKEKNGSDDDGDPFIVPLAMPLMAGPAIIAMVMIISQNSIISVWQSWLAIFLALFVSMLILLCGTFLQKILGSKGMRAIERLMGMILTIIATQMIFSGTGLARLLELSH